MTNEELKKKICDIIAPYVSAYGDDERIANVLIEAGIGDVGKYKEKLKLHRVFISKDGGDIKVLYGNNEINEIVKERNEYKHRAEVAERALLTACVNLIKDEVDDVNAELLARVVYTKALRKAKKEVEEENNAKN